MSPDSYASRATYNETRRQLKACKAELDATRAKLDAVRRVHAGCRQDSCPTLSALADPPPRARHGRDT